MAIDINVTKEWAGKRNRFPSAVCPVAGDPRCLPRPAYPSRGNILPFIYSLDQYSHATIIFVDHGEPGSGSQDRGKRRHRRARETIKRSEALELP